MAFLVFIEQLIIFLNYWIFLTGIRGQNIYHFCNSTNGTENRAIFLHKDRVRIFFSRRRGHIISYDIWRQYLIYRDIGAANKMGADK